MTPFGITFDYLCPFARNAHEHVVTALRGGAGWDVRFVPFSLTQVHVEEDEPAVWDRDDPDAESGILALQAGLAVREIQPERFPEAHLALFAARHDHGEDIRDPEVVRNALTSAGVDPAPILEHVESGEGLKVLRYEHTEAAEDHEVWGVPTLITERRSVFVRLLDRPRAGADSRARIERLLELVVDVPELHEFKQTDLPQ